MFANGQLGLQTNRLASVGRRGGGQMVSKVAF